MSLESIIIDLTNISKELKQADEFLAILRDVEHLRGICTDVAVNRVIIKIKGIIPTLVLDKSEKKIIRKALDELKVIKKMAAYQNNPENWMDYLYRETERFFPNVLFLPIDQGAAPQLGKNAGQCEGVSLEGIRGVLEEDRLFGHTISDVPIFRPVVRTQETATCDFTSFNNTVHFSDKIHAIQTALDLSTPLLVFKKHELSVGRSELLQSEHQILTKITQYFSCNENRAMQLALETPVIGTDGHVIGFVRDTNNKLIVIDANSGCYVFTDPSSEKFQRWCLWYLEKMGCLMEYRTFNIAPIIFKEEMFSPPQVLSSPPKYQPEQSLEEFNKSVAQYTEDSKKFIEAVAQYTEHCQKIIRRREQETKIGLENMALNKKLDGRFVKFVTRCKLIPPKIKAIRNEKKLIRASVLAPFPIIHPEDAKQRVDQLAERMDLIISKKAQLFLYPAQCEAAKRKRQDKYVEVMPSGSKTYMS